MVVFGKQEVTDLIAFSANEITVNAPRIASYSLMMKVVSNGVESNERALSYDQRNVILWWFSRMQKSRRSEKE